MRGFDKTEYKERVLKTQKLMEKNNLDVTVRVEGFLYVVGA